MIDINQPRVKEIIQEIHRAMERKAKKGSISNESIVKESRIFSIMCQYPEYVPAQIAIKLEEVYGYDMTGNDVIAVFRNRRMANPIERNEMLEWAGKVADCFEKAILGDKKSFEEYEIKRKEPALKNGKKHEVQERLAAIMIFERYSEIDIFDDSKKLELLGNTLAKYFFFDIADAIGETYGFPIYRDNKKNQEDSKDAKKLTYEQAIRRVTQLENALDRTNIMLQDLQDEFDEQLEENKIKEMTDFFAKLNSEKYGCILDELIRVRKGVDELRKNNFELPIEINGLLIMVKKLIQFVKDNHIDPIMKVNSVREVKATDIEFCNYEGSPFVTQNETKSVRVVSPGWIYKDKEIQISRPKVKEENNE